MAARPKAAPAPEKAADMAASRQHWGAYLSGLEKLPPAWPYDWRPDGSKPCAACCNRSWRQVRPDEGWCCDTCHPIDLPHGIGATP